MVGKQKKINQIKNLSKQTLAELKKQEEEAKTDWFKLRMDLKTGKLKDVHQVKKKRKEIARIKTIIKMKEFKERK